MQLIPGRYRHYKGGEYDVYGVARHSERDERFVVYRPRYGERELWVRPLGMFAETVDVGGRRTPRFERVGDLDGGGAGPQPGGVGDGKGST